MSHSAESNASSNLSHRLKKMMGRDMHEHHRVATPLELLFDLTFVIAFGVAASQFAHALAEGHFATGLVGFGFASFAICWAWINFSWFASAYDTDDWIFRTVTMVQMLGVVVLSIGLPRLFASIEHGGHLDTSIVVLGYVIMRIAMVTQWLRAAKQDPPRRSNCLTYAICISAAQIGWIAQIFLDFNLPMSLALSVVLIFVEMLGPVLAETKNGGTPWHAHHIAERYSLFAIIALGEGVVGTVATLSSGVEKGGWTLEAALVCMAGMILTFSMWWVYFILPSAQVLHARRDRSFVWGYGHMVLFASIIATGAGLHVVAYFVEGKAHITPFITLLTVAVPVSFFLVLIYALYFYLMRRLAQTYIWILIASALIVTASLMFVLLGGSLATGLIFLTLAPILSVVCYEVFGHRHQASDLQKL